MWDWITVLYRKRNYLTQSWNADISRAGRNWQGSQHHAAMIREGREDGKPFVWLKEAMRPLFSTQQVGQCFSRSCLIDWCTVTMCFWNKKSWLSYESKLSFLGAGHWLSDSCCPSRLAACALWHSVASFQTGQCSWAGSGVESVPFKSRDHISCPCSCCLWVALAGFL